MKETPITRLSMDEVKQSESLTDWEKVKGMTSEEIEAIAQDDPDCQPTDEDFWDDAMVVIPDTSPVSK